MNTLNAKPLTRKVFNSIFTAMILSELGLLISVTADGIIISRALGTLGMAAHGLTAPYFSIVAGIAGIFAVGARVKCATALGKSDVDAANRIFSSNGAVLMLTGIALAVLFLAGAEPISYILGARGLSADLAEPTSLYLRGQALGLPFSLLFSFLSPFMQLEGDRKQAVYATGTILVVDVALDLLSVYVFHWGMFGMGLASSASYLAACIVLLLHFRKKDAMMRFLPVIDRRAVLECMTTGLPHSTGQGMNVLRSLVLNWLIVFLAGSGALAAFSIQSNVKYLAAVLATSLGMTVSLYAGIAYGEEDRDTLRDVLRLAIRYSISIVGAGALVLLFCAPVIASFYTKGANYAMAETVLCCFALSLPFNAVNTVMLQYLQATGHLKLAHIHNILNKLVLIVVLSAALGLLMGIQGVWLAIPLSEILMLLLLCIMLWTRCGKISLGTDMFLLLPKDFDVPEEGRIDTAVTSMAQAIDLSEQAIRFCRAHGMSKRSAYYVGLCIEEVVGNILEHGVARHRTKSIHLRLVCRDQAVLLRIRDNCRAFNPVEFGRIYNLGLCAKNDSQSPEHNIGLKLVFSMADSVEYTSSMQLNNLVIKIRNSGEIQ